MLIWCLFVLGCQALSVQNSLVSPVDNSGRTSSLVNNVITVRFSSADGRLGTVGNTRIAEGFTNIGTNNGEMYRAPFVLSIEPRRIEFLKFALGMFPTHIYRKSTPSCRNLLTPIEKNSGLFRESLIIQQTVERLQSFGNNLIFMARRLLQISSQGERVDLALLGNQSIRDVLRANLTLALEQVDDTLNGISAVASSFADTLNVTNAMVNGLQTSITTQIGALNASLDAIELSTETMDRIVSQSLNINSSLFNIQALTQQAPLALESATDEINSLAESIYLELQAQPDDNATRALLQLTNTTIMRIRGLRDIVTQIRLMFDPLLLATTAFIKSVEDLRIDLNVRRALAALNKYLDQEIINTYNMTPLNSRRFPARYGTGSVSTTSSGINDAGALFTADYWYTTYTSDTRSDVDPDLPYALDDSLVPTSVRSSSQLNSWQLLSTLSSNFSFTFAHRRRFSFGCNNTRILEERNNLFQIDDIMSKVGPKGCIPNVNCVCWARVERERCVSGPGGFNAEVPAFSLVETPGVCIGPNQASGAQGSWFFTDASSDQSITSIAASEFFTSIEDFNVELRKTCKISTRNNERFRVSSSLSVLDVNTTGLFLNIMNDPTKCSIHSEEMTYTNAEQTLPSSFYLLASAAFYNLVRNISVPWEEEVHGTVDIHAKHTTIPFHTYGVYAPPDLAGLEDAPPNSTWESLGINPPPFQQTCEVLTKGMTGPTMEPLYLLVPRLLPQVATLQITTKNGTIIQKTALVQASSVNPNEADILTPKLVGGYLDSIFLTNSPLPYSDAGQGSYTYDFLDGDVSIQRQIEARKGYVNAFFQFFGDLDDLNILSTNSTEQSFASDDMFSPNHTFPYAPPFLFINETTGGPLDGFRQRYNPIDSPYTIDIFGGADAFAEQHRLGKFDPDILGTSPDRKRVRTILDRRNLTYIAKNETPCGVIVDPISIQQRGGQMGRWARTLQQVCLEFSGIFDPSQPELDIAKTITGTFKEWLVDAIFIIPGLDLTFVGSGELQCPNPQQVFVKPIAFSTAALSVSNAFPVAINISVETIVGEQGLDSFGSSATNVPEAVLACRQSSTWLMQPGDTVEVRLPACDLQTTRVQVLTTNTQIFVDCWEQTYNVSNIYLSQNISKYAGSISVTNQTQNQTSINIPEIQEFTRNIYTAVRQTQVLDQTYLIDNTIDLLQTLKTIRQARLNDTASLAQPNPANDTIRAMAEAHAAWIARGQQNIQAMALSSAAMTSNTRSVYNTTLQNALALQNASNELTDAYNAYKAIRESEVNNTIVIPPEIFQNDERLRNLSANASLELTRLVNAAKQAPRVTITPVGAFVASTQVAFTPATWHRMQSLVDRLATSFKDTPLYDVFKGIADVVVDVFNYAKDCALTTLRGQGEKAVDKCVCRSPAAIVCDYADKIWEILTIVMYVIGALAGAALLGGSIYLCVKAGQKKKTAGG